MKLNINKIMTIFSPLLGVILTYYVYKKLPIEELQKALPEMQFRWIIFAAGAHLLNHAVRSYRWGLLLKKKDQHIPFYKIYFAEMIGFFFNNLPFRPGELYRCQSLYRMHKIPPKQSLKALIIERAIDILFVFLFCLISLPFLFPIIKGMGSTILQTIEGKHRLPIILVITTCISMLVMIIGKNKNVKTKIASFFRELTYSIKQTYRTKKLSVWVSSIFILLLYFLLEYFCLFSLKGTADLTQGLTPAISIFIALNLSHLLPVGGQGLGLYHALIAFTLSYFGIQEKYALLYATITHAIQLFNSVVIGGICLLLSLKCTYRHPKQPKEQAKPQQKVSL